MEFAHVLCVADRGGSCPAGEVRITVTLERKRGLEVVRSECLSSVFQAVHGSDLRWLADQLTQETIGSILAESGWEAVAEVQQKSELRVDGREVVTYLVRRL